MLCSVLVGLGAGFLLWRSDPQLPSQARDGSDDGAADVATRDTSRPGAQTDDDDDPQSRRARERRRALRSHERESRRGRDERGHTNELAEVVTTEDALEVERLRAEIAALNEERTELMGDPIDSPTSTPSRFSGPALSDAVSGALINAQVPGDVESTDCSEHPCIVFGRLEGDEEDMEQIERSAALSPYRDDVLTLLFWATSLRNRRAGARAPETGLFALAFYSAEERIERGDALDRRIRARVMEYWNTDRPGTAD